MNFITDITNALNQGVDLLLDREIRLGITGLSRGGKTALITSLINNVCAFGDEETANRLARFKAYEESGICYGALAKARDLSIPSFPYHEAIESLYAEEPSWPNPTEGISELRLEIRYKNQSWFGSDSLKSLYLDIWDYPGEWLMDLMLLDLSFEEFSKLIRDRLGKIGSVIDSSEWVKNGCALKPEAPMLGQEQDLKHICALYTKWLCACKEYGFAMIVPGRFVLPGALAGTPLLEFVPWVWDEPRESSEESLYSTLAERYEAYKEKVVRKFYKDCFSRLDRQIIVVDCLKALMGGKETFMDINDSFDVLLKHFNYGSGSLFSRLFSPSIDKVMFAATKADAITNNQHANLHNLLKSMIKQASQRVRGDGSHCETMVLSAIRATECMQYKEESEVLVTSYLEDLAFFPGSVPAQWTRESMEFFQKNFALKNIRPPKLQMGQVLPSMNMDILLHYILGDKL